jgi:hypothetical protein
MTALDRNSPTSNYLQPTKFQVTFPRISTVTYFCQEVAIPGISSSPVRQTTPFTDLYRPGDKLVYDTFSMEFILDEELWGWEMIHDWMRGYAFPYSFDEYKNLKYQTDKVLSQTQPQYSDAQLTVLSALNNPKYNIKFVNIFPISISQVQFNTMASADKPMTAIATFRYQLYNIERV